GQYGAGQYGAGQPFGSGGPQYGAGQQYGDGRFAPAQQYTGAPAGDAGASGSAANVLGFVSIGVGALSILLTVLAVTGLLGMDAGIPLLLAVVGLGLAIVGLVQRGRRKPPALIGLVVSGLALVLPFIMIGIAMMIG
ncbi:MAG: hypothetical protein GXX90_01860, partial [Microbacteriaceae bacterium]|nr:hypothetical protein [Microbacteriaceae bacterium]